MPWFNPSTKSLANITLLWVDVDEQMPWNAYRHIIKEYKRHTLPFKTCNSDVLILFGKPSLNILGCPFPHRLPGWTCDVSVALAEPFVAVSSLIYGTTKTFLVYGTTNQQIPKQHQLQRTWRPTLIQSSRWSSFRALGPKVPSTPFSISEWASWWKDIWKGSQASWDVLPKHHLRVPAGYHYL